MDQQQRTAEQLRRNRLARETWELYTPHRRRVTRLVVNAAAARADAVLCVLGAGNGNDLDLDLLAKRFAALHLVDLDADALRFARDRQTPTTAARIVAHGGVDASNLAMAEMEDVGGEAWLAALREPPKLALPAPFDVVASTGLLTQLFEAVSLLLGEDHPRLLDAIAAVRRAHLRLVLDLLAPGGVGVVIVEIVSSDTFPGLRDLPEDALPATIARLIQQRNFFTGANPAVLMSLLETGELSADVAKAEITSPWRWEFIERTYAVYGVVIHRR
jgi:hypothetical protein